MQEIPSAPVFNITWIGLVALFLGIAGLVAVITVLFAARQPIIRWERLKALALAALCVVPALAVVAFIGAAFRTEVQVSPIHEIRFESPSQRAQSGHEQPAVADGFSAVLVSQSEHLEAADDEAEAARNPPPVSPARAVLHVQKTGKTAPDWAEKEPIPADDGVLLALSSERFATLAEAEQQVAALAAITVRDFYREGYPLPGNCTVPVALIEKHMRECVGEEIEKDFGKMYRVHLRLGLDSAMRREVHEAWDGQVARHRLIGFGGALGAAALFLGTCAAYLKLDDLTGGQYRRRLKLAAAALLAAGGLTAAMLA